MSITPQEALNQLTAGVCACGAAKQRKHSFCRACYRALPRDVRNALWAKILDGYEGAYEIALADLRAKGLVKGEAA